ncbi:hypothetical protein IFM89_024295 [Coptis chinensis]|uniref:FCP1 homology domain-containing protein n=1 Tax=Coptis chinensis TaxID=261450 RepID=A0A835MAM6_9MAGN|nr:hypothetical protein IFM89_024295 [Coptis chinensis]
MLKELVKIWDKDDLNLPWEKREYNESNSLLVDDSPYKALLNPAHIAIFPTSYDFRNKNDNSLGHVGDIRMYFEVLATSKNVQKYIQQHPFRKPAIIESHPCWQHYLEKVNILEEDLLLCKEENEQLKEEFREKVNTLEQELLLCKEENEKLKEELKKKVNTLEQELLLCKEENQKFKEELREKVNTLEQELFLCKEENGKLKEELKKKVNTLEQELLLCKEENEKFKEELKKKDQQQEGDMEEVQPQTDKAVHHHVPNEDVEMVFNEDAEMVPNESAEMVPNESPNFRGPSFSIGIPLSPIPKEKEK